MECSSYFCPDMMGTPEVMTEPPAHTRTNNPKAKPSSQDTNQTNRKALAVPRRARGHRQWAAPNPLHKSHSSIANS